MCHPTSPGISRVLVKLLLPWAVWVSDSSCSSDLLPCGVCVTSPVSAATAAGGRRESSREFKQGLTCYLLASAWMCAILGVSDVVRTEEEVEGAGRHAAMTAALGMSFPIK